MIFAIVAAVLAYQRAQASGRKGWVWAIAGLGVYIGVQLLVGMAAGMIIMVGVLAFRWSESTISDYELPINIVAIAAAFAATWGLLKFLDRPRREEVAAMPPPPPPTFSSESSPIDDRRD